MIYLFSITYIAFLYLNYVDAKTTYFVVNIIGSRGEKNPIAKYLINKFGAKKGIILIKSVIIIISPLIFMAYVESPIAISLTLLLLCLAFFFVVLNNIKVCKKINPNYKYLKGVIK
ncbi:MAG: DUF5658 family protein [Candidatus Cloacimonetes bacterium]|jgi:uncharacterized membrane protein|nr:DUF5658 family protein [Candidatus Cloacimonadota bacterium]